MFLVGTVSALAHAFLDRTEPPNGTTVARAPEEVKLWFTERLEPAFSAARVVNHAGRPVDRNDSRVDPSAPKLLRVSLTPLAPGTYRVIWRVGSIDTHVSDGEFTFTVK